MRERGRTRALALVAAALPAIVLLGCTSTVLVAIPPKIDLQPHKTIGLVDFTSNPPDRLDQFATQKFMSVVQASQPGVRFLELGPMDQLLKSAGRQRLDSETIKILGSRFNVDTIFTGAYEISNLKPRVSLGQDLTSLRAGVTVSMSLALKHWDTKTGATLWTNSRQGRWTVSNVGKEAGQALSFSVSDPAERHGQFMEQLVNAVAQDFRIVYERRPATKK
jgi:hypothetical protein